MDSVSIVIRCKNEDRFIGETLRGIFAQDFGLPRQVVVVDSGSTDNTLKIVQPFDVRVHEIPPQDFTFGYALNFGINKASGSIIVNLSAHCVPIGDRWLWSLVSPILEGTAAATFGRQVPIKGLNIFEEVSLRKHFPDHAVIKGRQPFSNANCAFLKAMWRERQFDEEISSWEDYLWYVLMKERYVFAYSPKAGVYHSHPFSLKAVQRRAYIDGRAFKRVKQKYDIDFLDGLCPTPKTKLLMFLRDMANHMKLFYEEGYARHIPLIPFVRFCAYRAYWRGYNSV